MFKTLKGNIIDYDKLDVNAIDLDDICNALTNINRFGGHSIRPYSVAEHTVLCLRIAKELGYSEREQFLTLIHDFTEAYVVDLPTPLKTLLPEFQRYEQIVEFAIYERFGIKPPTPEEYDKVKVVDSTALAIEMRDLTKHTHKDFVTSIVPLNMVDRFHLGKKKYKSAKIFSGLIKKSFNSLSSIEGADIL